MSSLPPTGKNPLLDVAAPTDGFKFPCGYVFSLNFKTAQRCRLSLLIAVPFFSELYCDVGKCFLSASNVQSLFFAEQFVITL
jgi:hypothetical protein